MDDRLRLWAENLGTAELTKAVSKSGGDYCFEERLAATIELQIRRRESKRIFMQRARARTANAARALLNPKRIWERSVEQDAEHVCGWPPVTVTWMATQGYPVRVGRVSRDG